MAFPVRAAAQKALTRMPLWGQKAGRWKASAQQSDGQEEVGVGLLWGLALGPH